MFCLLMIPALAWISCSDSDSPADGGNPPTSDTEPPQFAGAFVDTVAPDQVRVAFDQKIMPTTAAGFTVTANGPPATITTALLYGDTLLALRLTSDVDYPDGLTVAYDSATGSVTDRADPANKASSFGPVAVSNNIPNRIFTVAGGNGSGGGGDGGLAAAAQFDEPHAVAVQGSYVYVADHRNTAIRRFEVGGDITTVLASPLIGRPQDVWFSDLKLYVAGNVHCIVEYDFSALAKVVGGTAFQPDFDGDGGAATAAKMRAPEGLWMTGDTVYVADSGNHCVRRFILDGDIETVAGDGSTGADAGDGGAATGATIQNPFGIRGYGGDLYICSTRGSIRRFTDGGNITTIVGSGLNRPRGICIHDGYIYIADTDNHAIRRVPIGGGTLETIAGVGLSGYTGDGGAATEARLDSPYGVFVEDGYLYIADTNNHAIRRMYVPR
jgi:hypothetical protein